MKIKSLLTVFLTLVGLTAATGAGYALASLMPTPSSASNSNLPPLSDLDLPPQTQNGITATLQSYYADATRLIFQVHITSGKGMIVGLNLNDENGTFVNASAGSGPAGNVDPSLNQIEFNTETPLPGERFKGQLEFSVTEDLEAAGGMAGFHFDLDIPILPALTFNPRQTVWANGLEILLDRVIITPSFTQAYVCYRKPSEADWTIGYDTTLQVNAQSAPVQTYGLLFDSDYGDGSKGGEPGWKPPLQTGRCVKIGFPVGDEQPTLLTLTIPALERSIPEVIPAGELAAAYERLKAEGIDMEWHLVDHGAYPEYKKLPAGMSEDQAYEQFIQALGYIYPGEWIFEVPLNPQVGKE